MPLRDEIVVAVKLGGHTVWLAWVNWIWMAHMSNALGEVSTFQFCYYKRLCVYLRQLYGVHREEKTKASGRPPPRDETQAPTLTHPPAPQTRSCGSSLGPSNVPRTTYIDAFDAQIQPILICEMVKTVTTKKTL